MWFRRRAIRLFDRQREARLRPEYADMYPRLRPDRWYPIPKLVKRLDVRPSGSPRPLLDEHFEFRAGLDRRNPAWSELRQRADDRPPEQPALLQDWEARLRDMFARPDRGSRR